MMGLGYDVYIGAQIGTLYTQAHMMVYFGFAYAIPCFKRNY